MEEIASRVIPRRETCELLWQDVDLLEIQHANPGHVSSPVESTDLLVADLVG